MSKIVVEGRVALNQDFDRLIRAVGAAGLLPAYEAGGEVIATDARARSPARSGPGGGRLKRGIRHVGRIVKATRVEVDVGPSYDAFYGWFQELGTRRHAARPFLRPAIRAKRKAAETVVRQRLAPVLATIARRGRG